MLSQEQDGQERVISYYSKCYSKTERRYCTTRNELLAVICSIKHFHHYLYGRHFKVRSDHGSLRWLMNFKICEGKLARFMELLAAYDLVGCFGFNGPLRQYFSLYRAASQREGDREEIG